jgi:hypothetical protein
MLFHNLDWSLHIETKINKASSILGLLRRTLGRAPKQIKLLAYTSLCRPILEYACHVWDPYLQKHIKNIEKVQNRAIRFISGLKGREVSITHHRESLKLDTLERRRKHARECLLWKIILDLNSENPSPISTEFTDVLTNIIFNTRSRSQNLPTSLTSRTNVFHFSFIPRTIRDIHD